MRTKNEVPTDTGEGGRLDTHNSNASGVTLNRIDVFRLGFVAFRAWKAMLAYALIFTAISALYVVLTPHKFSAVAVVTAPPGASGSSALSQLRSLARDASALPAVSDPEERFSLFQNLIFSETVARAMLEKYDFKYLIFSSQWDKERKEWKKSSSITDRFKNEALGALGFNSAKIPGPRQMQNFISAHVSTNQDITSGILEIRMVSTDGALSRDFLRSLIIETDRVIRNSDITSLRAIVGDLRAKIPQVALQSESEALIMTLSNLEVQLSQATVGPAYSISEIAPTFIEDRIVWPRPFLILALGFFAGAIAGFALEIFEFRPIDLFKGRLRESAAPDNTAFSPIPPSKRQQMRDGKFNG